MADLDESEGPVVTGISPTVGLPGTKITIRGENLGESKDDVIELTINGMSCLQSLEYHSSRKLVCLRPNAPGTGEIIVNTFSGGNGTCTVKITIQQPEVKQLLDPLEEADEWKEEDFDIQTPGFSTKAASPAYTRKIINPMGGTPETARRQGSQSVDNLKEMFPNASGDLLAENFNPVWFLLEMHRYTSFFDLKLGLGRLKREVEQSDQAPVQFMRDNLDIFLQSYDTLSDVNELLIRNESESQGGSLTDKVEELLRESARRAEEVFDGILKCKGRADATRNALNILQSHRVLFNLPRSIERNIKAGDYDLVTSDYEKANVHMANTRVNIFKRVLEEVQHQIRNFRGELHRQLLVLPATLEEQKRLIKYLIELDCESDPAWDCITNMHRWLLRLLFYSKEEFQLGHIHTACELTPLPPGLSNYETTPIVPPRIRGASFVDRGHNRTVSDVSYASSTSSQSTAYPIPSVKVQDRDTARLTTTTRGVGSGGEREGGGGSTVASRVDTSGRPSRILFVEDLTEIVLTNLPNFWRLTQAYFTGSLFQGVSMLSENQQLLTRNCGQNQPKFEAMMVEIMEVYTDMVNCSLFLDAFDDLSKKRKEKLGEWVPFDDDLLESSGYWLPQIVRQIRDCVNYLQSLDLPPKAVDLTQQLAFNVRTLCSQTLFHRAARDIEVLHEREDWQVQSEEGGIVTSLPVLFENVVVETLLSLKEIVIVKLVDDKEGGVAGEVDSRDNKELRDNTVGHFQGLWDHLVGAFDLLAFHWEEEVHQENPMGQGQSMAGNIEEGEFSLPNSDERLLIVMSNLQFIMNEVVPRLFTSFVNHGYPRCDSVQDEVLDDVHELDGKVFDEYIKRKSESISGIIEQGIQVGNFDWEQCVPPKEVRSYIKEVLFNLVIIHAEVFAVSEHIVPRVLQRLVELVSDEFLRYIKEVEVFGYNGILYAYIELGALEEVLQPFLNDESRKNFDKVREHLKEWDVQASESASKIVEEFHRKSKLQLRCFKMTVSQNQDDSEAV